MVGTYVPGSHARPLWPDDASALVGIGGVPHPTIAPFVPDGTGPWPAIVVLPGGGYEIKAEHEAEPIARWLNDLGIAAFVIDYRVAPHRHPAPLDDARRAIRTVRACASEWNVDPARIGVLGFSAGGHLAATASTIWDAGDETAEDPIDRVSSRPDLAVLCYPVISMVAEPHVGSRRNLLGDEADASLATALSGELRVNRETPPTFLWHTADDAVVDVRHSLGYAAALRAHDVPFALHVFPRGRHGLGLAPEDPVVRTWTSLCATFLRERGF